jgi:hypothetical protein
MDNKLEDLKKAIAALPRVAGNSLHMEDLLAPALAALPDLLKDPSAWRSLYIDYEPPFLMRLYLPICAGDRTVYLSLHYFFSAPGSGPSDRAQITNPYAGHPELVNKESANNYHPHPWASAFHLLAGGYHQHVGLAKDLGYSNDPASPLRPATYEVKEQQANDPDKNRYAFNNPLIWHRVLPNAGQPVSTMMITYMPDNWNQCGPKPASQQRPLTEQERVFMFGHFQKILASQPRQKPAQTPKTPPKKFGFG